ncbi:MAG: c-type cytochrome [Chloroflexi bacterium]|nr:c-type cytochrome [Chloroflexota bacterium]
MRLPAPALVIVALLLAGCAGRGWQSAPLSGYASSGERIYFTADDDLGRPVRYRGGPAFGGMGMMNGRLACVSCHGPDGRGGRHFMHMQVMDAPDIRWSALAGEDEHAEQAGGDHAGAHAEYDLETFRLAVVEGKHPDGQPLSSDMPRWNLSAGAAADLLEYLKSLP